MTTAIKDSLQNSGVNIVSYDLTNIGDKDFRTIISKIKGVNPDLIVLEMFSPEIELMTRQLRDLGVKTPVTSVETFEWSAEPQLFEGQWFVSDSIQPNFTEKFKNAYNTEPAAGSSYVYDLVSMLISIQEKQKEPIKPADLPNLINKIGVWKSPIFGEVKIDKDGFFLTEASVKIIKGGKAIAAY